MLGRERQPGSHAGESQPPVGRLLGVPVEGIDGRKQETSHSGVSRNDCTVGQEVGLEDEQRENNQCRNVAEHFFGREEHQQSQ